MSHPGGGGGSNPSTQDLGGGGVSTPLILADDKVQIQDDCKNLYFTAMDINNSYWWYLLGTIFLASNHFSLNHQIFVVPVGGLLVTH